MGGSSLKEEVEGGDGGFDANVGTQSGFEFVTKSAQIRVVVRTTKPTATPSRHESARHTAARFLFRLSGGATGRWWWCDGSWCIKAFFVRFEGVEGSCDLSRCIRYLRWKRMGYHDIVE